MKILPTIAAGVCTLVLAVGASAQNAGQDIKDAGSASKKAAKKTGSAVKDGTAGLGLASTGRWSKL